MKTGQVSGFGVLDVTTIGIELSLKNKGGTNTVFSTRAQIKGNLLVTPINGNSTFTQAYHADLSSSGSVFEIPLGA